MLVPPRVMLWIVRDDGERLIWFVVETSALAQVAVKSFDGTYGGPRAVVQGSGFIVSLSSPAPRTARSDPTDRVIGTLLYLTQAELAASDAYEDKSYFRIEVTLESGLSAFVYAGAAAAD